MRSTFLGVAFFLVSSIFAISPVYPLEDSPTDAASGSTGVFLSGSENVSAESPAIPSALTPPAIEGSPQYTKNELCSAAASVAAANKLPISFFANLIHQESGFKTHVVSPAGAQGIAQFMPRVAASYGLVNPFEPMAALAASGKLLADLLSQFGNLGLAAAAYNAGPKRVQNWMAQRSKLPAETRHYVRSITGRPAEHWARQDEEKDTEASLPLHARCPDLLLIEAQRNAPIGQPAEILSSSQTAEVLSSPRGGKIVVRRPMPQPSQFAMGLPVSRFAAMASHLMENKAPAPRTSRRAKSNARRDKLMIRFASMATPSIMVEEKVTTSPQRAKSKGTSKETASEGKAP